MYKIYITNSNYNEWYWYDQDNLLLIDDNNIKINPLEYKLFNNDIIDKNYKLVFSNIRSDKYIPGILLLNGNTFGRANNKKLLYKCVPNDPKLPIFLLPYENKNVSFNKNINNKFVLFKFLNWDSKHPNGELINVLGDITDLHAYYEYQLYCKNLCISIKNFINEVNKKMKNKKEKDIINSIILNNKNIQKRFDRFIFTIDPKNSTDLDDAMSIKDNVISIYIANVPILIDFYDLWNSFSERISTIYLPDKKRPMLPTLISENLCSLLENENRFVFCMDIILNNEKDTIIDIQFTNLLVNISKNYTYDEVNASIDKTEYKYYREIYNICQNLCKKYKYIKEIKDSHDLIAFMMILMNYESAKKMISFKEGIYRSLKIKDINENKNIENVPNDVYNFIKIWQSSSGQYTNFINRENHDLMASSIEDYLHITSPIRRLVDLLNIMKLQHLLKLNKFTDAANNFYNKWINNLNYINTTMRAIRKVQIDCSLLTLCVNNPLILEEIYDGYIFDKIDWNNQYLQYTVYISKIKIFIRINIKDELDDYSKHKFKLFLIEDGITLKKKIRGEILLN